MTCILRQEVTLRTVGILQEIAGIFCEYHFTGNQKIKPPTSIVGGSMNRLDINALFQPGGK